ncbi:unnamed protein product [Lasius platythorax]|uniref:Uncharacterized protein n=1 Tax=Lasius platythorax TaxID=488582 RepID=A0AAV2NL24_9HYME
MAWLPCYSEQRLTAFIDPKVVVNEYIGGFRSCTLAEETDADVGLKLAASSARILVCRKPCSCLKVGNSVLVCRDASQKRRDEESNFSTMTWTNQSSQCTTGRFRDAKDYRACRATLVYGNCHGPEENCHGRLIDEFLGQWGYRAATIKPRGGDSENVHALVIRLAHLLLF